MVAGIYSPNIMVPIASEEKPFSEIYVINASGSDEVFINPRQQAAEYDCTVHNCVGDVVRQDVVRLDRQMKFDVPKSGLLKLMKRK